MHRLLQVFGGINTPSATAELKIQQIPSRYAETRGECKFHSTAVNYVHRRTALTAGGHLKSMPKNVSVMKLVDRLDLWTI